jgi:prepilin-type N-terminal cleavage/methylation domain-containing protein
MRTISRRHLPRRWARGFTLLEMIVVLGLLTIAAAVAVPIARWSVLAVHQAETAEDAARRVDTAVDALRRDVWCAGRVISPSPGMLALTRADGHQIIWESVGDGAWRRTESSFPSQEWTGLPSGISFSMDGPTVRVTIPATGK